MINAYQSDTALPYGFAAGVLSVLFESQLHLCLPENHKQSVFIDKATIKVVASQNSLGLGRHFHISETQRSVGKAIKKTFAASTVP
ncbi:MAG: hypothetical protein C4293_02445 [Nitrospiraceae bacterium]